MRTPRRLTGRARAAALAAAVLFVAGGLAACGDDDGADLRDLNSETAIPSRPSD